MLKRVMQPAKKATLAAHSRTHRGDRTENLLCVQWNEINCDLMPLEWLPHDWLESLEGARFSSWLCQLNPRTT